MATKFPAWREQARVNLVLLVLISFVMGIAVSAVWFLRSAAQNAAVDSGSMAHLPQSHRSVIEALNTPVTIRFYSVLDTSAGAGLGGLCKKSG